MEKRSVVIITTTAAANDPQVTKMKEELSTKLGGGDQVHIYYTDDTGTTQDRFTQLRDLCQLALDHRIILFYGSWHKSSILVNFYNCCINWYHPTYLSYSVLKHHLLTQRE